LLDLSAADDRFSPLLLDATLKHAMEAWEACDSSQDPLLAVATKDATESLLHSPLTGDRRFIKDPRLKPCRLIRLDASSDPPCVVIAVNVDAAMYLNHGLVVSGSDRDVRHLRLVWTLGLEQDTEHGARWRLLTSQDD
jgi:hypothetical protein